MRHFRSVLAAFLLSVPSYCGAVELHPYPDFRITEAQWAGYLAQVKTSFGSSVRENPQAHLAVYFDKTTETYYTFTTVGHPAYPAWIARRLVQEGPRFFVDQVGYFAGNEAPFSTLFDQFQQQNRRMVDELTRQTISKP